MNRSVLFSHVAQWEALGSAHGPNVNNHFRVPWSGASNRHITQVFKKPNRSLEESFKSINQSIHQARVRKQAVTGRGSSPTLCPLTNAALWLARWEWTGEFKSATKIKIMRTTVSNHNSTYSLVWQKEINITWFATVSLSLYSISICF